MRWSAAGWRRRRSTWLCRTGDARALRTSARKQFMRAHGTVFMVLGAMQWFWYSSDKRRERFVSICRDRDVQQMTWDSAT